MSKNTFKKGACKGLGATPKHGWHRNTGRLLEKIWNIKETGDI